MLLNEIKKTVKVVKAPKTGDTMMVKASRYLGTPAEKVKILDFHKISDNHYEIDVIAVGKDPEKDKEDIYQVNQDGIVLIGPPDTHGNLARAP